MTTTTTTIGIPDLHTIVTGQPHTVETAPADPLSLLSSPDGLREWLDSYAPTDQVGMSESVYHCPIAMYLQSHGIAAWVGGTHVGTTNANARPLPAWAQRFTWLVDRHEHGPMRAAYTRALLHRAVRDTAL